MMNYNEATIDHYIGMHKVRVSVKENMLSNPGLITQKDYEEMITLKGKGWVCSIDEIIVGFAIIDITTKNIWALFIHPDHEKKGIGKELFKIMMDWGFNQNVDAFWLSTAPNSRAERFYTKAGWRKTGMTAGGEVKFEMSLKDYQQQNKEK